MQSDARIRSKDSASIAPATIFLGVDVEGRDHVYRQRDRAVHVIDRDGDRVHVERLEDRHVNEWMDFVASEVCGWDSAAYGAWAYEPSADD